MMAAGRHFAKKVDKSPYLGNASTGRDAIWHGNACPLIAILLFTLSDFKKFEFLKIHDGGLPPKFEVPNLSTWV